MKLTGSKVVYIVVSIAAILIGLSTLNFMSGGPGLIGIIQYVYNPMASNLVSFSSAGKIIVADPINRSLVAPPTFPAYPESVKLKIRTLLREKMFVELNRELEALQINAKRSPWDRDLLRAGYFAFEYQENAFEELLDEWVIQTPGNYQPYLARASYFYQRAWEARGNKWTSETEQDQLKEMRRLVVIALKSVTKAKKIDNKPMPIYRLTIGMAQLLGKHRSAQRSIEQALAIDPTDYYIRADYMSNLQPRWGGSFEQMESFVEASLPFASDNPRLNQLKGLVYSEAARIRRKNDENKKAEELYNTALGFGENSFVYSGRGKARNELKRFEEALSDFSKAVDLYPEYADHYYWRSLAHADLEDYKSSAIDIHRAIQLDPFDSYYVKHNKWLAIQLIREGYLLRKDRKYLEALDMFRYSLLLNSRDRDAYYQRSVVLSEMNQSDLAELDLQKAIEIKPDDYESYSRLDWVLTRQGKFDEIIKYWDDYLSLQPGDSRAYLEKGGAYFQKRDFVNAVASAKIAAEMGNADGKAMYGKYKHLAN